ncbi:MAG: hypothetical protein ABIO76_01890 [Ginsengibacter sp.]
MMKNFFLGLLMLLAITATSQKINIVPEPVEIEMLGTASSFNDTQSLGLLRQTFAL